MSEQLIYEKEDSGCCPMDELEDWEESTSKETNQFEKENFTMHIREELGGYKAYCPVDVMAEAIGGEFTDKLVENICNQTNQRIRVSMRYGIKYVAIAPFLHHLQQHMVFE